MGETIRVNFGEPLALFAITDAVLLPHAIQPLHIFEPRYRQMIEHVLDQSCQLAMATLDRPAQSGHDDSIRPAVCVGQIVEHKETVDGRHYILLHGVCRARIKRLLEPDDDRLYPTAWLEPVESASTTLPLDAVRSDLHDLLSGPRLRRLNNAGKVLEWLESDEIPTHALLELIGFTLLNDSEVRYQLLEEANPCSRADVIRSELTRLDRLINIARHQDHDWPKGMSWN